jgi:hypothetical protein
MLLAVRRRYTFTAMVISEWWLVDGALRQA